MIGNILSNMLVSERYELKRFLEARGAAAGEVEDILQDLFLKTTQVTSRITIPKKYLFRMAYSLLLDDRRATKRRRTRERIWHDIFSVCADGSDGRAQPDRILIGREELDATVTRISRLPPRTATIFLRFRVDEHDQREIASELGISLSAVEKHLQRAYRTMAKYRAMEAA